MTQTVNAEWKMGTGSEPRKTPNLRKSVAGSVLVPFYHLIGSSKCCAEA